MAWSLINAILAGEQGENGEKSGCGRKRKLLALSKCISLSFLY